MLRIKLTLLDILIEFFISVNHEFSQITLLEVCTPAHTAVLAGNETFLKKNITQDRKRFITQ